MHEKLKQILISAIGKAGYKVPAGFDFGPAENEKFGDFSTNAALIIGKKAGETPKDVAEKIVANIKDKNIKNTEIAGPGFINFHMCPEFFWQELSEILKSGQEFGRGDKNHRQKILVEFISANPTGPLHIGNARGGPIGETLSNVLSWLGHEVGREFYVNDAGSQIAKFGKTLAYYYIVKTDPNFRFPEDGYPGDYPKEVSEDIQKEHAVEIEALKDELLPEFFIKHGLELTTRRIKDDIELLGIKFDNFVYESDFLSSGKSQAIVNQLKEIGKTTDKEGAVWFTADESASRRIDGDDKENVLVRSDAEKSLTYFASDIAYHKDKFDRDFKKLIDIWGPNHHGHIARLKSAMAALGYDPKNLEIMLYQNVKLKKDGEVKQMGKRLGNFINIADLVNKLKVPADVFKFMIISHSSSSILDFDLDLALEQSEKNPVYYLQYAYARICSILRKADKKVVEELEKIARGEVSAGMSEFTNLTDKKEIYLILKLAEFPEVLKKIESDFQIQALPHFATKIAGGYHDFYSSNIVLSDDKKLTRSRLLLILATRNVLKICLTLMGISAPEKM
ncbi:MAG: arginine--tRNA ligase [Candidatus Berkelbacteria bacterium]|nr:arginine--tRNA ligase [Candidatus Berkelbacteria bacterium]